MVFGPGFFWVGVEGESAVFVEDDFGIFEAVSSEEEIDLVEAVFACECFGWGDVRCVFAGEGFVA